MTDEPEEDTFLDRFESAAWGIGLAIVCAALIVMFIVGARSERYTPFVWLGGVWLVTVLGSFAIGFIGQWCGWAWAERASTLATALVVLWVAGVFVRHPIVQLVRGEAVRPQDGLVVVMGLLWIALGLLLYISSVREPDGQQDNPLRSPAAVLLWPVLLVMSAPLQSAICLLVLGGLVSGGYFVGHWLGHPYVGAGVAVLGLAALVCHWRRR